MSEKESLKNIAENTADENAKEQIDGNKEVILEVAQNEATELLKTDNIENEDQKMTVEQVGMSKRGKIAALCLATTLFAGSFAGFAEAGSRRHISHDIENGVGRTVEHVFDGAGRGADRGMEKVMLNFFGLETREQRADRLREERDAERRMEREDRNYQRELAVLSRENDRAIVSVLRDYQNGKITREKKDELVKEYNAMYEKKIIDINVKYNRI